MTKRMRRAERRKQSSQSMLAAKDALAPISLQSRLSSLKQLAEGERDQALVLTAELTQDNAELRRQLGIQKGHLAESRRVADQLMNILKS